ncbi:MAG: C69 family dipeptidase [Deltaproteobacteria bacterium]|nr:C69 family dipeptidase [Deltaproteobacteria bacterium]
MCDTFLALPSVTSDGSIIFGKNSDREPNEAQALEYYPAQEYELPVNVQCTYRSIPQVRETHATLLCRPFWMWGAEMGANEKGVVMGNEAVWTRMPLQKNDGLTGMDLLRLALERSSNAARALELMVQLLADFGQGGICGYEDKHMAYHNSYIIADPGEGWVLETAGELWAAVKIKDSYSISNGLTIGEDFDECHPQLIETARKKRWLKKGATFNFTRCYGDWFYTTFSASRQRCDRSRELLDLNRGLLDVASGIKMLRDHWTPGYRPDSHFLGNRLCAHAAGRLARHAVQTTGSLLAHLKPDRQTYFVTGTAAPCTAIFKPVRLGENMLPPIGPAPTGTYDHQSLWWQHEKLHRSVLLDHSNRLGSYCRARDELENWWINRADTATHEECRELTREAFRQARRKTEEWITLVQSLPVARRNKWVYRHYWQRQNARVAITVK